MANNNRRTRAEATAAAAAAATREAEAAAAAAAAASETETETTAAAAGITEEEMMILRGSDLLVRTPELEIGFYSCKFLGLKPVQSPKNKPQQRITLVNAIVDGVPRSWRIYNGQLETTLSQLATLCNLSQESDCVKILIAAKGKEKLPLMVELSPDEEHRNYNFRNKPKEKNE